MSPSGNATGSATNSRVESRAAVTPFTDTERTVVAGAHAHRSGRRLQIGSLDRPFDRDRAAARRPFRRRTTPRPRSSYAAFPCARRPPVTRRRRDTRRTSSSPRRTAPVRSDSSRPFRNDVVPAQGRRSLSEVSRESTKFAASRLELESIVISLRASTASLVTTWAFPRSSMFSNTFTPWYVSPGWTKPAAASSRRETRAVGPHGLDRGSGRRFHRRARPRRTSRRPPSARGPPAERLDPAAPVTTPWPTDGRTTSLRCSREPRERPAAVHTETVEDRARGSSRGLAERERTRTGPDFERQPFSSTTLPAASKTCRTSGRASTSLTTGAFTSSA